MISSAKTNSQSRVRRTLLYADRYPKALTFLEKLWIALHISVYDDGPLRWSKDGMTLILDDEDFKTRGPSLYMQLMNSGNVLSLIRNLYRYGFQVSKQCKSSKKEGDPEKITHICYQPKFNRKDPEIFHASSPNAYQYMVSMAQSLRSKITAGRDPQEALTECLAGYGNNDLNHHYSDQTKFKHQCLDRKPTPVISENQTSFQGVLGLARSTSGSYVESKRRPGEEVSEDGLANSGILERDSDHEKNESPTKKSKVIGENTLEFLQKLSINKRVWGTFNLDDENAHKLSPNVTSESDDSNLKISDVRRVDKSEYGVVKDDSVSPLPSLEPPENPFSQSIAFSDILSTQNKEIQECSPRTTICNFSIKNALTACPKRHHKTVSSPKTRHFSGIFPNAPFPNKPYLNYHIVPKIPSSSLPRRHSPVRQLPPVLMIPHVLTSSGYVPLVNTGGVTGQQSNGFPTEGAVGWTLAEDDQCNIKQEEQWTENVFPEPILIEPKVEKDC